MPMYHEDPSEPDQRSAHCTSEYTDIAPIPIQGRSLSRRLSEESIRTEFCEGPLLNSPPRPATPQHAAVSHAVSDRAELIERLKRGESPTWVPNRHLESLIRQDDPSPPRTPSQQTDSASIALLPAPTITPEGHGTNQAQQGVDLYQEGLSIERPRSALHSGNFTPVDLSPGVQRTEAATRRDDEDRLHSPRAAWMSTSPPRGYSPFDFAHGTPNYRREAFRASGPSSLSSSLSSNFVYKPPTSPLVQSESNDELDLTLPLDSFSLGANSPRNSRRHTLNFAHSPFGNAAVHRQSSLRRESTFPYQAHQPRRSLNSTPNFSLGTSPQPIALSSSRRPSFSSDASSLHHASMVGSYEESILRGRMSTTPSKPLDFMAQIGVLGLGKCKSSLRCPPHVTLPFSAVFYSYASGSHLNEDGPSPYVGQIDLENGLPNPDEGQRAKRKLHSRYRGRKRGPDSGDPSAQDSPAELSDCDTSPKPGKPKRRSQSPKAPPGGAYRIPEKGQLQVIIKNQNKTAVKLFLVPYDLAGMEAGTKTFIRQRSYSAGPIIEADIPVANAAPAAADRPTLRYLIHLHICCPSKGRYYLYKSIRVVFANRVPDGKEKLRNEATYPDPRFSPYKPIRVMHPPPQSATSHLSASHTASTSPGATLAAELNFRRRSLGFAFAGHHPQPHYHHHHQQAHALNDTFRQPPQPTVQPITWPFKVTPSPSPAADRDTDADTEMTAPISSSPTTPTPTAPSDISYGSGGPQRSPAAAASPPPPTAAAGSVPVAEGLLSQRLRSLGVVHSAPATAAAGATSPPSPSAPTSTSTDRDAIAER